MSYCYCSRFCHIVIVTGCDLLLMQQMGSIIILLSAVEVQLLLQQVGPNC